MCFARRSAVSVNMSAATSADDVPSNAPNETPDAADVDLKAILENASSRPNLANWVHMIPIWVAFRVYAFINAYGESNVPALELKVLSLSGGDGDIIGFKRIRKARTLIGMWLFPELGTDYAEDEYPDQVAFIKWLTDVVEDFVKVHFKVATAHIPAPPNSSVTIRYLYYARRTTSVPSLGGAPYTFLIPAITAHLSLTLSKGAADAECDDEDDQYVLKQLSTSTFMMEGRGWLGEQREIANVEALDELDYSYSFIRDIHGVWVPGKGVEVTVFKHTGDIDPMATVTLYEDQAHGAISFMTFNVIETLMAIEHVDTMRHALLLTADADSVVLSATSAKALAIADVIPRILLLAEWNDPIAALRMVLRFAPGIYSIFSDLVRKREDGGERKVPTAEGLLKWIDDGGSLERGGSEAYIANVTLTLLETIAAEFTYSCFMTNDLKLHRIASSGHLFEFQNCDAPSLHSSYPLLRGRHVLSHEPEAGGTYHFFPSSRLSVSDAIILRSVTGVVGTKK